MGIDEGDVLGGDLPPEDDGADLGLHDEAAGGGDGGGHGTGFAESDLDAQAAAPWGDDALRDLWATDSDGARADLGAEHPNDVTSGDAATASDLATEDSTADAVAPAPDTDVPHHVAGGSHGADGSDAGAADDSIELDIDDPATDLDEQPGADGSDLPGVLQSPLSGLTAPEVTDHSLATLGIAPAVFADALAQMGIADPELGLDGRTVGIAMGEVGVDAVVEHAGLDDLAALVADGRQVLLTGPPDAPVLALADIDVARGSCVLEDVATGARHVVGLDAVESSWAASGYEVVTGSAPAAPSDIAGRGAASVTVVQAVIAAWQ